jgi:uncharacterized protein YndB with AHSA1/START domain
MTESAAASGTGEVRMDGDSADLVFRRTLRHPPERIWAALTEPEQLRAWFMTASATIDGRPGGSVDMVTGPAAFHWTGRILSWDPPRLYGYEWNADPCPELPQGERSIVRWELEPAGDETVLTLTHRRLTTRTALGFAPGTHALLDRLAAHLEGLPLPVWMERYREVQHAYPVWSPE